MRLWIVAIGAVVGLVAGAIEPEMAWLGLFVGGLVAWLFERQRALTTRIAALEARLAAHPQPEPATSEAPQPEAPIAPAPAVEPQPMPAEPPPLQQPLWSEATEAVSAVLVAPPRPPPDPLAPIKRWFSEGNVPVKVGMLVLFAGVAALLKYATDEGWLHFPIELRLAGIAAAATAGLAFGYRQRHERRTFALSLQGGSIGILVLTIFAALRLYELLPAELAFALLIVIVAATGLLAVLQDALPLAALGVLAGFLAPILVSTGSGNHVVLFSWYAVLNAAIFGVAWKKAWRILNLLGFVGTFGIASAWSVLKYEPDLFATTEPFLALFFAFYLIIPALYGVRRTTTRGEALVDGTLVFGTPVVTMALQALLLDGDLIPLALSALVIGVCHVALARSLWHREQMRVLGEAYAALAIAFATLAVPLALSARSSAGVFALEGAALIWLGLRQDRRLARYSGIALQFLAAPFFLYGLVTNPETGTRLPLANGTFTGALLLVAGAGAGALAYWRMRRAAAPATTLFVLATLWWIFAGLVEIDEFVAPHLDQDAVVAFVALTALLFAELHRRLDAPLLAYATGATFVAGIAALFDQLGERTIPLTGWGAAAWLVFAAFGLRALVSLKNAPEKAVALAHLAWLWIPALVAGLSLDGLAAEHDLGDGWRTALLALPLLAIQAFALAKPHAIAYPLADRFDAHRALLLGTQSVLVTLGFAISLWQPGDAAPLPFVPLANPLDLASAAAIVLVATSAPIHRLAIAAGGALVLFSAATLRAVHHLADVPWDAALLPSATAQTSLAIVWSVLGVAAWVAGSRRINRPLWLAGAVLMGLVLAKLALVDRQHLGNLTGIVSFLAYGILCTVVGYLAPAPPRAAPPPPPPEPTP